MFSIPVPSSCFCFNSFKFSFDIISSTSVKDLAIILEELNWCCFSERISSEYVTLLKRRRAETLSVFATTASENVKVMTPALRSNVKFSKDGEVVSLICSVAWIALPFVIARTSTPNGSSIVDA